MKSLTNGLQGKNRKKTHEYQNTLTDEMQFSCSH